MYIWFTHRHIRPTVSKGSIGSRIVGGSGIGTKPHTFRNVFSMLLTDLIFASWNCIIIFICVQYLVHTPRIQVTYITVDYGHLMYSKAVTYLLTFKKKIQNQNYNLFHIYLYISYIYSTHSIHLYSFVYKTVIILYIILFINVIHIIYMYSYRVRTSAVSPNPVEQYKAKKCVETCISFLRVLCSLGRVNNMLEMSSSISKGGFESPVSIKYPKTLSFSICTIGNCTGEKQFYL